MAARSRQDDPRPTSTRGLNVHVTVDERDVVTVHAAGNLDIYTISRLRQRRRHYSGQEYNSGTR